jgi:hypothetical protein
MVKMAPGGVQVPHIKWWRGMMDDGVEVGDDVGWLS